MRRRADRDNREQRLVFNAIDHTRVVFADGHGRIAIPQPELAVHLLGPAAVRIFGLDQDTRDHFHTLVFRELRRDHIPGGAQVDVLFPCADIGERRGIQVPVAHELKPVRERIDVHFVVADREFMRPALHRVVLVTVQHDVLRQVIKIHPVLVGRLNGFHGILLGHPLPFMEGAFHAGHLPVQARLIARARKGSGQQEQCDREKNDRRIALDKA